MLANKVDGRNPRHKDHLAQLKNAYAELLLPVTVGLRASVAEALVQGKPVWENKKNATRTAAKEIREAAELVAEQIGLVQKNIAKQ